MKKKITYFNLNSSLSEWLKNALKLAPESTNAEEFSNAITELENGESQTLIVEMNDGNNPFHSESIIKCSELSIDVRRRRVTRSGSEISLTPKEFDILLFLASNRGEVFTKEQIYRAVWDETYLFDDSNIMAFIRKLRKKIEPNPDAPEYILTIWGVGYKFNDKN